MPDTATQIRNYYEEITIRVRTSEGTRLETRQDVAVV